jgi:hypothetical protein
MEWAEEALMRLLLRLVGYGLVGIAFVTGVLDAARSLADGAFVMTPLTQSLYQLLSDRYLLLQPAIEQHVSAVLWSRVVLPLTLWPTALAALTFGIVLVLLGSWRRKSDTPATI